MSQARYPIPDIVLAGGLMQAARFGADAERAHLYRELASMVPQLGCADHDLVRRVLFCPGYTPPLEAVRDAAARARMAAVERPDA